MSTPLTFAHFRQAIMGPMMSQLHTFLDGPTSFNEPFSGEFNMCMFQTLAEFSRRLPPPPEASPGWPSSSATPGVQITELPGPTSAAGPAGPTGATAGPPGPNRGPSGPPPPGVAPSSHNAAPMEPLLVDTSSAADPPADDLHTLLSTYSEEQWEEPGAAGPSPAASEYSAATQPSPSGGDISAPGATFCPPTNGLPGTQYSACAVQPPPFATPGQSPQIRLVQASPQGCAVSPQSFTGGSPQPCGVQSPAQSLAAASPQSYASPGSRHASVSPGQCYASPPPNGQMVSPPYGQPLRQSCQFQPRAAPPSGYQETGMFLSPPQQQMVPGEVLVDRDRGTSECSTWPTP